MKSINIYGQSSVSPNLRTNVGRALHDPWPSHAAYPPTYGVINGLSGNLAVYLATLLKDGNAYFWISAADMDLTTALAFLDSISNWQVPGLSGGYFGEGFNASMRSRLTTKILQSQLTEWQANN